MYVYKVCLLNRNYESKQNPNEIACSFQQQYTHTERYLHAVALETEHGGQTLTFLCVPQGL